jgi:ribosomal protein S18 acetylase RimI-like enzyme
MDIPSPISFLVRYSRPYNPRVTSLQNDSRISIRIAVPADLPEILRQRRRMYEDMNYKDTKALDSMVSMCTPFLAEALSSGSFRSWLGLMNGNVAGGGAVLLSPWPCHPYDSTCRRATILNVYTYPEYRRKGVARALMQAMLDWCKTEGFTAVFLHASDDGRPLYESLGFKFNNEMRLKF